MTATTASWEGSARAPSPLERPERMPEDEADMASTPPLRVMLVDDHEVVRDGIKALLAPNDDIVVCAEAATVRQAVAEADRALPDVIETASNINDDRLGFPLTYWNNLGLLAGLGLVLAVGLAGDRSERLAVRALSAAAAYSIYLVIGREFGRAELPGG